MTTLSVVTWNAAGAGRDRADLLDALDSLIGDTRADVIALQEVRGKRPVLADVPGYRLIQGTRTRRHPEADGTALLVRRSPATRVGRHGTLTPTEDWRGPKHGLVHRGRGFAWGDVGDQLRVVSVHRTKPPWGRDQARAEDKALARFAGRRRSRARALLYIGDHNENPGDRTEEHATPRLARDHGLIVVPGHHVDWLAVGGTRALVGPAEVFRSFGSDHRAVAYPVTLTDPTPPRKSWSPA